MSEETIWLLVGSVSVMLKSKFKQDEKGLWYNERLEEEAKKRQNYTESRRNNGKGGGRPKKEEPLNNHMQNHKVIHKEDENENKVVKYLIPKEYLQEKISIELETLNMKSGLSPEEFDFCLTQWSLKSEEGGWEYSGNDETDLKRLRAGFEKWLNSWSRNERNTKKPTGRKSNKDSAEDILEINKLAKDGISND